MRLSTFILKGIAGLDHSPEATFLVRQKVTLYTGLRCDLSVKTKPVLFQGLIHQKSRLYTVVTRTGNSVHDVTSLLCSMFTFNKIVIVPGGNFYYYYYFAIGAE